MSECIHCNAQTDKENGIVVGALGPINESICNICRADDLEEHTFLSQREADVVALKNIGGYSHSQIGDIIGIEKSTVDEYSKRISDKLTRAKVTLNELKSLE